MQSNLAERFDSTVAECLEELSEEEQSFIPALRDPVKGPKLREIMENSLKR